MDVAAKLIATLVAADWPAPTRVHAVVTTRATGDMALSPLLEETLPGRPVWLRQVHGAKVIDADARPVLPEADAAVARKAGTVCAVRMADCLPVLLCDERGSIVGIAHAGWRGLADGVIEATLAAMKMPSSRLLAWLGPAIGPAAYEVGEDVRAALAGYESAFKETRPGHWLLDLYAVARRRLAQQGIERVYGGGDCTYTDSKRFFSYRRDRARERLAAFIWLA
jgi:YfiH family protein